jgi:type IV secretion system protein VirB1
MHILRFLYPYVDRLRSKSMTKRALYLAVFSGVLAVQTAYGAGAEDFHALAQRCAPSVPSSVMAPLVKVESGFNPYAIGVVGGRLERQATNKAEAVATITALQAAGLKFSAGVGQVFLGNWKAYGLTNDSVFEPCQNIRAAAAIYKACYDRALTDIPNPAIAEQAAYSCYYSNNFITGFKPDAPGQIPYVQKVLNSAAELKDQPAPVVQAIPFIPNKPVGESTKPAKASVVKPSAPELVDFEATAQISTPPVAVSAATPDVGQAQPEKTVKAVPAAPIPQPNPYVYLPAGEQSPDAQSAMVY